MVTDWCDHWGGVVESNGHEWIKSAASIGTGACVELAAEGDSILLRNSRCPDIEVRFTGREMAAFFEGIRNGDFDHLIIDQR
jgi:hypothetical protein